MTEGDRGLGLRGGVLAQQGAQGRSGHRTIKGDEGCRMINTASGVGQVLNKLLLMLLLLIVFKFLI